MEMLEIRNNKLNIIILDACRSGDENNDPKKKTYNGMKSTISPKTTACSTVKNNIHQQFAVIYACASQRYSYDGVDSTTNSLFTGAFLECLRETKDKDDLPLDEIMCQVTSRVVTELKQKQQPCWLFSLTERFFFKNGLY
jgi:hypothetical protein